MGGYKTIDPILLAWAEARGLHVYTGHKQNDVRSMTIYLWIGARHESTGHIWLDPPNELGLVGVHAAAGSLPLRRCGVARKALSRVRRL